MSYSVLMSVYYKEKADYLKQAMESIYRQTMPTDDFVLVCDGPLTDELEDVIREMEALFGEKLSLVRLEKNGGLGAALNEGIRHCRNELVARMDSDDIACEDRCERQLAVFAEHPELAICSGTVQEFTLSPEDAGVSRKLPEKQEEILRFAGKRNPFNHPCVMYRKSAVEAAGSYQDFYLLEDYYLWIRMLLAGYQGYNIPETLLYMRAGASMYQRRAGRRYAASQRKLFRYMKDAGMIGSRQYVTSCLIRTASGLAPNWLRQFLFQKLLRK